MNFKFWKKEKKGEKDNTEFLRMLLLIIIILIIICQYLENMLIIYG